jgi:hypothetical protein
MPTIEPSERHPVPDRKGAHVFRRKRSPFYQAEAFIDGRKARKSLRTDRLTTAFKLATDWHKRLLKESRATVGRYKLDRLGTNPTIAELFDSYKLTLPPSKRAYAEMKWNTIENYWRTIEVGDVTAQTFRDFYKWRRRKKTPAGTVVKNHSIHKDMMVIRQVLRYAIEEGHIAHLPIIPKVGKIEANPRPWLSRSQWDHLMLVALDRGDDPNPRVRQQRRDLEDFLIGLIESTMRVSELRGLTAGQVRIEKPKKADAYAVIQVNGKTGHRTVIAGGLFPTMYERRAKGRKPGDLLWPHSQRDAFRELITAAGLRHDEYGNLRNLKSIRATAISFRILSQAPSPNLLLIARNAGTSVTMIDTFYAKRLTAEMGAEQLAKSTLE